MATSFKPGANIEYKITQWSYSRYKDYEKCPRLARYKHIESKYNPALKEPGNAAMDRGTAIHKIAEMYVKGNVDYQPELGDFREEFKDLRALKPLTEQEWAFTTSWEPTGWFAKDTWLRVKTDVAAQVDPKYIRIVDHKTGKPNEYEHSEQGELYGIAGFIMFPKAEMVDAEFWYLDQGSIMTNTYTRDQLPALIKSWGNKSYNLLNDRLFPTNPGRHCSWCFYSKSKGGPCQF